MTGTRRINRTDSMRSRAAPSPGEATVAGTATLRAHGVAAAATMQAEPGRDKSKLSRLAVRTHQAAGWARLRNSVRVEKDSPSAASNAMRQPRTRMRAIGTPRHNF